MTKTRLISLLAIASGALFAGCASENPYAVNQPQEYNFLGIVKTTTNSYEPISPTTIPLRSTEVVTHRNPSGDKVELLWGLITLADY